MTLGSVKQQAFVTYLATELMRQVAKASFEDEDLLYAIREGISLRIEKLQTEPAIYSQGLLVWRLYL